jgi:hypothetical protein
MGMTALRTLHVTTLLLAIGASHSALSADVRVSVVVMASGERAVRVEAALNNSPEATWRFFSTEDGLRCWAAPVIQLDLRTGGSLKTNYNKSAAIGDAGTISLGILNYVDNEIMTYKVRLNDAFSADLRAHDGNLQEIIQLERRPDGGTHLVSSMVGWGAGEEWDKAVAFFAKGNEWSYRRLAECVENSTL